VEEFQFARANFSDMTLASGKTHRACKRLCVEADPRHLVRRGPCWARPGTSPLPHLRTESRASPEPETIRSVPKVALKSPSMRDRRGSLPLLDMSTEALILARQLHMDFQEVKSIMQELRDAPHLHNGGLAPEHFRQVLQGIFAVEISQHVLEDAYAECGAAGPIDARQFITWCRDHFFAMEARKLEHIEEDLTLELAKRHHCSPLDLDQVKCKFDAFDLDKSGIIDHDEFEQMIYSLLGCSSWSDLPRNRLQRFWIEADQDRDGVLDFEEFTHWYMKYFASADSQSLMEAFYASYLPQIPH